MLEVETKFRSDDLDAVGERLLALDAIAGEPEHHEDTYLRHPCRDFKTTGEALRVRKVGLVASVTYKGSKVALTDSALKARKELEWCLAPGDTDGTNMLDLLTSLGFTISTTVKKARRSFRFPDDHPNQRFTVTLDDVEQVGTFTEIECLVDQANEAQLERTGQSIRSLAEELRLGPAEKQSYLAMLLEKTT